MRCCQSQNREHERNGASGYGKDHDIVVCKKHGVHHGGLLLCLERGGRSPATLAQSVSFHTSEKFGNRLSVPPDRHGT